MAFELSLERLGVDRIDILYIHDPRSLSQVFDQAYPTVRELRENGAVRAIGIGTGGADFLAQCAKEAEFDTLLVAGGLDYTILGQAAFEELLPLCQEKGIGATVAPYGHRALDALDRGREYSPGRSAEMATPVRRIDEVCRRHGVPIRAAALQLPLAHLAVAAVIPGSSSAEQAANNVELFSHPIPNELWDDLKKSGLLAREAPAPAG